MAKWRAIYADISTSGQVNQLTEFEKLLFTWMIPHADDWGVLTGDLMELKLKVMPGTDRQSPELDDALGRIEEVGLVWRYEPDNEGPLIQFRKWDNHQPIRKDRRQDSEHTLYPAFCQLPTKDRQSQAATGHTILDNTIPDKNIEDKGKSLVKHWSVQCYKHVVHRHIKMPLREVWVEFAERNYPEGDGQFDALKTDIKAFMAKGWYEGNIDWFMKWVIEGKPEKWAGGKYAKSKRGRSAPTIDYDEALKRQAAEAELDA